MLRRIVLLILPIAIAAAGLTVVAEADAQVVRVAPVQGPRGWLGISYQVATTRTNGATRQSLVIQEVVGDSPAQRAGIEAGDTLLAVNDIRATEALMRSLSTSLSPGDEVRLRVRRDGRDQEFRVRAGEWPAELEREWYLSDPDRVFMIDPDSLRGRVRIYLDSARRQLEVMPRMRMAPEIEFRRFFPDSTIVWRDSVRVWRGPGGRGFSYILPRDSMRLRTDSLFFHFDAGAGRFGFRGDSLLSFEMDTLRARLRTLDRDWMLFTDSSFFTPRNYGIAMFGERAIAGAEMTELNADLGEYFGTDRGLLVVRVPEGTPAHRAGLEAGDVVVRANGRDVRTIADLRAEFRRRSTDQPVRLEIMRRRARQTIELRQD